MLACWGSLPLAGAVSAFGLPMELKLGGEVRLVQPNGVMSGKWGGRGLTGMPHAGCFPSGLWINSASFQEQHGVRVAAGEFMLSPRLGFLLPSVTRPPCMPGCHPYITAPSLFLALRSTSLMALAGGDVGNIPGCPRLPQLLVVAVLVVSLHHTPTPGLHLFQATGTSCPCRSCAPPCSSLPVQAGDFTEKCPREL